jgi:hypothetical protein
MEPLGDQVHQAEKRKEVESTSSPSPKKQETNFSIAIPGLIHGVGGPMSASGPDGGAKAEKTLDHEWVKVWAAKIKAYFLEQRNSKQIKGVKERFPDFEAAFDKLERALIDPDIPAGECRALLRAVRAACRKKDAHELASSFPTGTETNLLEIVNVKLLWSMGDRTLTPGAPVKTLNKENESSTMSPDYATPSPEVVGDHVRIAKPGATVEKLLEFIAGDTKDKLTTYPALQVRVVVDTIPSGVSALTLSESPAESKKRIVIEMKESIPAEILKRLFRADIVLSDKVVVVVERADLN